MFNIINLNCIIIRSDIIITNNYISNIIHVYFKMYILDLFCELNQLIHLKDLTQKSGSFTKLYFFHC